MSNTTSISKTKRVSNTNKVNIPPVVTQDVKQSKHMLWRIFTYSFANLCKTTSVWVFFFINFALTFLITVILPACIKDMRSFPGLFDMVSSQIFIVLILGCSLAGESNSDPAERVFILARPIKRSTYLWSKLLSTFCITTILSILIICMWVIAASTNMKFAFKNGMGKDLVLPTKPFEIQAMVTIFIVATLGGVVGTIYRNYLKNRISSMIAMIFILLIYIVYMIVNQLVWNNSADKSNTIKYTYFPTLFLVLTVVLTGLGFWLNKKEDIRI